jgi:hypothetical protein
MYVCMYVCMHVCISELPIQSLRHMHDLVVRYMYVCMYVCYVCMHMLAYV